MFQHDSELDDLLRRPMQMAMDDYEYDDEYDDEDEEEDLFGDDLLSAVQEDKEAAEASALADFMGSGEEEEQVEAAPDEPPPEQTKLFTRPGIRRSLLGYGLLIVAGFIPLVLLVLFAIAAGLSVTMSLFSVLFLAGLGLSIYNFYYSSKRGYDFTVSFDVRSFFKGHELIIVALVSLLVAFWNLGSMENGQPFTLSGKDIPTQSADLTPASEMMTSSADSASSDALPPAEDEIIFDSSQDKPSIDKVENIAGGAVSLAGTKKNVGDTLNRYADNAAGTAVSIVGGADLPAEYRPDASAKQPDVLSNDNKLINTFFFGGSLAAALGYALVVGIAGLLFGLMRSFETPFSEKTVEIINIETGEVTSDKEPIAAIMTPVNFVARALIGLFYGGTLGFLLGLAVLLPLLMFFQNALLNPTQQPLLQALGMSSNPDVAFANAVTVGGILVPLVLLMVAKLSPQGASVSQDLIVQHYGIKPTGRFIPSDQLTPEGNIMNPAMINFGAEGGAAIALIPDDELETELANSKLMDELAMEDDNLTAEIIEEFGRDFETVFGIDTRELIATPDKRQSTVNRKVLASALDESFGELGNVPVEISAELGHASIPITEWLNLREGTLVLLDKPANEEIDILFNGESKGRGKLIVADDSLAVQVSSTQFQNGNGAGHHLDLV